MKKKKKKSSNLAQRASKTGACWECGSEEHLRKDCPKCKHKLAKKDKIAEVVLAHCKLELEQELTKGGLNDDDTASATSF